MYQGEVRGGQGGRGIIVSLISCQSHAWHRIKHADPKTGKSPKSLTPLYMKYRLKAGIVREKTSEIN